MLIKHETNLSGPSSVLGAASAALAANGWTLTYIGAEGTGTRAHLTKNGIQVNLRSALNESKALFNDASGYTFSGIGMNVSTGYAAAQPWHTQPGGPVDKVYGSGQAVCAPFNGSANYWLFEDSSTNVMLVIESPSGVFQQLAWGVSIDKESSFTGGAYCYGTQRGAGVNAKTTNTTPLSELFSCYVRADVDAFVGKWVGTGIYITQYSAGWTGKNAVVSSQDTNIVPVSKPIRWRSVGVLDGHPVMLPARLYVERDTAGTYAVLGTIPMLFETAKVTDSLQAGTTVYIGRDSYMLFPGFSVKLTDKTQAAFVGSGRRIACATKETDGKVLSSPGAIDAGYIVADKTYPVRLWNTNLGAEAAIVSVNYADLYGISFDGNAFLSLGPGEGGSCSLTVKATGKAAVDDTVVFQLAGDVTRSPAIRVTGNRIAMLYPAPDWAAGVQESRLFASSLIESYSGKEQRASLVSKPVRSLSFTVRTMDALETAKAEALLYGWHARAYGVPCWHEQRRLTAAAQPGEHVLTLDTAYGAFVAGGYVAIRLSDDELTVSRVASVGNETLTLDDPVQVKLPVGTQIVPVIFARLDSDVKNTSDSLEVGEFSLSFKEET